LLDAGVERVHVDVQDLPHGGNLASVTRDPLRRRIAVFVVAVFVVLAWRPTTSHLRAVSLLRRFGDPALGPSPKVREEPLDVAPVRAGDAPVRARLYTPAGGGEAGIVLVPGVHRLGIDEPRLVRFARAVAQENVVVLTPEIHELLDYRIEAASVDTIGAAAHALHERLGGPVGVMGMSFAGGLALLTAADPRFADDVAFVVAVGAHDDLARVARFFATNAIPRPDGSILTLTAHEYGPMVLVYDRLEDFFPAADVPAVRESLRLWLWEERDQAKARLALVPSPSREKLAALYDGKLDTIAPELLAEIDRRKDAMSAASPHGHLGSLRAPVLLLHGTGDRVIPASETLWLAQDVPHGLVKDVLLSPAIVHVELEGEPGVAEQWALVDFMADVLARASSP
jgi:dienelactone hydrolase